MRVKIDVDANHYYRCLAIGVPEVDDLLHKQYYALCVRLLLSLVLYLTFFSGTFRSR